MNKNLTKKFIMGTTLLSLSTVITPLSSRQFVFAETKNEHAVQSHNLSKLTEHELKSIEKYIELKNGKYILKKNHLPKYVNDIVQEELNKTNAYIDSFINEYGGEVFYDYNHKTVMSVGLLTRSPGKNDIQFNWNSVRIYIDAPNLRMLGAGAIAGAGGALGFAVKTLGATVLIAVLSGFIGQKLSEVEDGIWFDYNFFFNRVTHFGWQ